MFSSENAFNWHQFLQYFNSRIVICLSSQLQSFCHISLDIIKLNKRELNSFYFQFVSNFELRLFLPVDFRTSSRWTAFETCRPSSTAAPQSTPSKRSSTTSRKSFRRHRHLKTSMLTWMTSTWTMSMLTNWLEIFSPG